MKNFILILLFIITIFSLLTLLLNHYFKKRKFIKYIPSIIMFLLAVYTFYVAKTSTEGFLDIAYILLTVMSIVGLASSLVTALILDFVQRKKN